MNPFLRRNFEALDSLEPLARMNDHMPNRGEHRTILDSQAARLIGKFL